MSKPLSKLLGLWKRDLDVRVEGLPSYNDAIDDLDQRSPDKEVLKTLLHENFDSFFHQVHFYIEIKDWYNDGIDKTAQEIINSMDKWITKGGHNV